MQTILDSRGVSIHIWQDTSNATLTAEGFFFEGELTSAGLTTDNANIVDVPEAPQDWIGRRYCYINNEWVRNPDFVD